MRIYQLLSICLFSGLFAATAQSPYENAHADIDILHYAFRINLNDSTNTIEGEATVRVLFRQENDADMTLDLVGKHAGGGMTVTSVSRDREVLKYQHLQDKLLITLPAAPPNGVPQLITIRYKGIPADGLVISQNRHGDRTFFGDNWPNRARHWLPVVDHPSDKATCEWIVNAPSHYKVIGNGALKEEKDLGNGFTRTYWSEFTPIPTKVMVIGVARFAVKEAGVVDNVVVSSWLYPQDSTKGFVDYQPAVDILRYFEERIGDYAYEKLANVQSTTIFGGMENAGNIFYNENSIYGFEYPGLVKTIAHEIAHQWFGNSVSETNYSHIWLSEGFATYLAADYLRYKYGKDAFLKEMLADRAAVMGFVKHSPDVPVVDSTEADLMNLLNDNSYQKGGWVLYMLHQEVGEQAFWKGLRQFFAKYRNANANTLDLKEIMQQVSGKNLDTFFQQWLYTPGTPSLRGTWQYKAGSGKVLIKLKQQTSYVYDINLEIGFFTGSNVLEKTETVRVNAKKMKFKLSAGSAPVNVRFDPNTLLLANWELTKK